MRKIAVLGLTLASLLAATPARAADRIYWTDVTSGQIKWANLDGTGAQQTLVSSEIQPGGITIDPAGGRIYWAARLPNCFGQCGLIRVAPLDGTGSPQTLFQSYGFAVASDHASGRIYGDQPGIFVASLDGTGAPQTLYPTSLSDDVGAPAGLTIDPDGGRMWWADDSGSAAGIRQASLFGVPGTDHTWFASETNAFGVVLDPIAQKLYWTTNTTTGAIRTGNADGTATAQNVFTAQYNPFGLTLDPIAGKIYWADGLTNIDVGNLNGTGSPQPLLTDGGGPRFLAILKTPVGTGNPTVSGGSQAGQALSCSGGSWAPDIVSAFLYRAPHTVTYSWFRNGVLVGGANGSTFTPTAGGNYACRVTATNEAGSTSVDSGARAVAAPPEPAPPAFGTATLVAFKLGALKIAASGPLKVVISNTNSFLISGVVSGQTAHRVSIARARIIRLKPKPFAVNGHANTTVGLKLPPPLQRLLRRAHKLTLRLTVVVHDPVGHTRTLTKTVTVRLKPAH